MRIVEIAMIENTVFSSAYARFKDVTMFYHCSNVGCPFGLGVGPVKHLLLGVATHDDRSTDSGDFKFPAVRL